MFLLQCQKQVDQLARREPCYELAYPMQLESIKKLASSCDNEASKLTDSLVSQPRVAVRVM